MEGKETKNKTQGSRTGSYTWLICFLGVILFHPLSFTASAEPPENNECIFYAYTASNNHYFLIKEGAVMFGQNITLEHNCETLTVSANNQFIGSAVNSSTLNFNLNPGFYNLTITGDNNTEFINQIEVLPNALTWYGEWQEWKYGEITFDELVDLNLAEAQENWASFLTAVIIWVLVVYVYWNLINSYVDRNYAEEVQ